MKLEQSTKFSIVLSEKELVSVLSCVTFVIEQDFELTDKSKRQVCDLRQKFLESLCTKYLPEKECTKK